MITFNLLLMLLVRTVCDKTIRSIATSTVAAHMFNGSMYGTHSMYSSANERTAMNDETRKNKNISTKYTGIQT